MGSIFSEKKADTTKTTCIEITAESYKCIDISAYVPTCIMITSNVPTSEYYEKPRADLLITEAPQLQIALINNEAPILNVNMDEDGVYYVTDFDTVYIDITNWNANAEYVNIFSSQDGNDAVVFLDEAEQRIIWALDDYALDGVQMWLYAQAKESDKLISPQANVTVMQMEQTIQPALSSWVSQYENTVLNITIENYDATYTYADPIVTGGTAIRTDNVIAWTLPDVTADTYHEISITATAPLMYESLAGVSGGSVLVNPCGAGDWVLYNESYDPDNIYGGYPQDPNTCVSAQKVSSTSTSWYVQFRADYNGSLHPVTGAYFPSVQYYKTVSKPFSGASDAYFCAAVKDEVEAVANTFSSFSCVVYESGVAGTTCTIQYKEERLYGLISYNGTEPIFYCGSVYYGCDGGYYRRAYSRTVLNGTPLPEDHML